MDDLIRDLHQFGDLTSNFTPVDVVAVFGLSLLLTLVVGWVYRFTHRGVSYSQSFVHTLVILGVVASFLMLIIGSNVARAFTLVGTMSIIRFRTAVKETRDIAFVFMALAVGMACGTRFYLLGAFATVCLAGTVIMLSKFGMFQKVVRERILILRVPTSLDYEVTLGEPFRKFLDEWHLISVESVGDQTQQDLIYSVELKRRGDPAKLLEELRRINDNQKVSLVLGQQELDL
jgi:hypothetical protein